MERLKASKLSVYVTLNLFVFFGFLEGLEGLVAVCTKSDGGNIGIAVSHSELAENLLATRFAAGCEFGDGAAAGGLGGLDTVGSVRAADFFVLRPCYFAERRAGRASLSAKYARL